VNEGIADWQLPIANFSRCRRSENRQLAIGNQQSRVDARGQRIGNWQLEIGNQESMPESENRQLAIANRQ
jgi:hypothetical protein